MSAVPPCTGACACGAQITNLTAFPATHAQLGVQASTRSLFRSLFRIPGMDSAAEEQMSSPTSASSLPACW